MAANFFKIRNGVTLGSLSADPSSPTNGDIYYNTSTNKFRKYENGAWSDLSTAASGSSSVIAKAAFTTSLADVGGTANNAYNATSTTLTKTTNGAFPSAIAHTTASNGTDGVTLTTGDYLLLQNEASAANNGVYEITTLGSGGAAWVLTRVAEFNTAAELTKGASVLIITGNFFQYTTFALRATVTTLGTDPINFDKYDGYDNKVYPSSGSTSVTASSTIAIAQYNKTQTIKVSGNGGAVTTATAPFGTSGAAPLDGTIITLVGTSDANSVTIPYADTSRGCLVNGDCELTNGATLTLSYDAESARFLEKGRT